MPFLLWKRHFHFHRAIPWQEMYSAEKSATVQLNFLIL